MSEDLVRKVVNEFVAGGDKQDVRRIEKVLHPDFRITINRFMGQKGVTVLLKDAYLKMLESKQIGGLPRSIDFESIDIVDHIANVKVKLRSDKLHFTSFYSLILNDSNEWQLIHDVPFVAAI